MKIVYNWNSEYTEYLSIVQSLSREARKRVLIASPYVGEGVNEILGNIKASEKRFVVDLSRASVGNGATNPYVVEKLLKVAKVKKLANLHAKVFIFDNKAIVGSANLSLNAFSRRIEVGVVIDENEALRLIVVIFEKIWSDAEDISDGDIQNMKKYWDEMKEYRRKGGLPNPEPPPIKQKDFSKNEGEIKRIILENRPDSTILHERKKSFDIAKKIARKLKKQNLSKKEIYVLLSRINEHTAAISPVARRNINLILRNDLRKLNITFRNLLDEGEDLINRIDTILYSPDKPRGISIGVISSILFAYNPKKYCIYNKEVLRGLSRIFSSVEEVKDGESYVNFNYLANRVKTKYKVSPLALDNILYKIGLSL
ncbi:MAG: phospholipase D-like domain-containing protein [Candidatus Bathyarchaeia archaeon]